MDSLLLAFTIALIYILRSQLTTSATEDQEQMEAQGRKAQSKNAVITEGSQAARSQTSDGHDGGDAMDRTVHVHNHVHYHITRLIRRRGSNNKRPRTRRLPRQERVHNEAQSSQVTNTGHHHRTPEATQPEPQEIPISTTAGGRVESPSKQSAQAVGVQSQVQRKEPTVIIGSDESKGDDYEKGQVPVKNEIEEVAASEKADAKSTASTELAVVLPPEKSKTPPKLTAKERAFLEAGVLGKAGPYRHEVNDLSAAAAIDAEVCKIIARNRERDTVNDEYQCNKLLWAEERWDKKVKSATCTKDASQEDYDINKAHTIQHSSEEQGSDEETKVSISPPDTPAKHTPDTPPTSIDDTSPPSSSGATSTPPSSVSAMPDQKDLASQQHAPDHATKEAVPSTHVPEAKSSILDVTATTDVPTSSAVVQPDTAANTSANNVHNTPSRPAYLAKKQVLVDTSAMILEQEYKIAFPDGHKLIATSTDQYLCGADALIKSSTAQDILISPGLTVQTLQQHLENNRAGKNNFADEDLARALYTLGRARNKTLFVGVYADGKPSQLLHFDQSDNEQVEHQVLWISNDLNGSLRGFDGKYMKGHWSAMVRAKPTTPDRPTAESKAASADKQHPSPAEGSAPTANRTVTEPTTEDDVLGSKHTRVEQDNSLAVDRLDDRDSLESSSPIGIRTPSIESSMEPAALSETTAEEDDGAYDAPTCPSPRMSPVDLTLGFKDDVDALMAKADNHNDAGYMGDPEEVLQVAPDNEATPKESQSQRANTIGSSLLLGDEAMTDPSDSAVEDALKATHKNGDIAMTMALDHGSENVFGASSDECALPDCPDVHVQQPDLARDTLQPYFNDMEMTDDMPDASQLPDLPPNPEFDRAQDPSHTMTDEEFHAALEAGLEVDDLMELAGNTQVSALEEDDQQPPTGTNDTVHPEHISFPFNTDPPQFLFKFGAQATVETCSDGVQRRTHDAPGEPPMQADSFQQGGDSTMYDGSDNFQGNHPSMHDAKGTQEGLDEAEAFLNDLDVQDPHPRDDLGQDHSGHDQYSKHVIGKDMVEADLISRKNADKVGGTPPQATAFASSPPTIISPPYIPGLTMSPPTPKFPELAPGPAPSAPDTSEMKEEVEPLPEGVLSRLRQRVIAQGHVTFYEKYVQGQEPPLSSGEPKRAELERMILEEASRNHSYWKAELNKIKKERTANNDQQYKGHPVYIHTKRWHSDGVDKDKLREEMLSIARNRKSAAQWQSQLVTEETSMEEAPPEVPSAAQLASMAPMPLAFDGGLETWTRSLLPAANSASASSIPSARNRVPKSGRDKKPQKRGDKRP
ncbi:hypothetical protein PMZ80_002069 [Knufia obscura]|uniref:Uncharacterized protein n=1 Tax=Knufia obscura TaxID=1635080 RepID=A0ABR0RW86_9EURO|nr:hypothetical protein PMZ80_002069 [Knufia obscura]